MIFISRSPDNNGMLPCWLDAKETSMINKSKLIGIAAIVAVGLTSPAFAQRYPVTAYDSGVHAFGMVPGGGGVGSYSPEASGGGSFGYNESLLRHDW
jgi:hypothetical protein